MRACVIDARSLMGMRCVGQRRVPGARVGGMMLRLGMNKITLTCLPVAQHHSQ